jgi:O-acetyl-ADP-ribose deacetylase (regulator of RNase III)
LAEPVEIILCDQQVALVRAWRRAFADQAAVEVRLGDLLELEVDALVSPANSYGIMDGGIDAVLSRHFPHVEERVQAAIAERGGALPVGRALIVATEDDVVPYLVCAPTMEVPGDFGHTTNAFRAMRALLSAIARFNADNEGAILSVGVPGLCTGIGGMEARVAARQMARAYAEWQSKRE